ncbi:MAG: molybdenum cofactor biosynthesis protein MoaE [Calditrichaeota bacterium]|nr:molybdenum cofactor biosynthesis protein MoaE [Calditrichota bacterium]HQU72914.1 molybdenum cofactor biosynthesis protein MoaE [Calditrichia bacterium]
MIRITEDPIDVAAVWQAAQSPDCGAVNLFTGTVRDHSRGRAVTGLTFEAYAAMAEKKLSEIAGEARERWDVRKVAMVHRVGELGIGEVAVVIAVATPHREDGFLACRYLIDRLKAVVPIWKKERTADGQEWVSPTP